MFFQNQVLPTEIKPEKVRFCLAFLICKKKPKVFKKPEFQNLASKKPNWQPCCRGRLQSLCVDCSIASLYCVTMTWQQIFKGSFQVTVQGVLGMWLLNTDTSLAENAARQWLLIAVSFVVLYYVKRGMNEKEALLRQRSAIFATVAVIWGIFVTV